MTTTAPGWMTYSRVALLAVGQAHGVAQRVQEVALEELLAVDLAFLQVAVVGMRMLS